MLSWIIKCTSEWIARRFMFQTSLERFRAVVPYPVGKALLVCVMLAPWAALVLLAQALGYRGTAEVTLTRTWLTFAALPVGIGLVLAALAGIGRLSGYRPYNQSWTDLAASDAHDLTDRLLAAAAGAGFDIVWRNAAGHSFVGLRGLELERHLVGVLGSPRVFPMRLFVQTHSQAAARYGVTMCLTNRRLVLWDTGEREECRAVGESLVAIATAHVPGSI